MTVTRDSNTPPEMGALFQAFNRAADGFDAEVVFHASVNLLVAAINFRAANRDDALGDAADVAAQLPALVTKQWDRLPSTEDIEVPLNGN